MGVYAVTGAASGIGHAIAQSLASDGHEVITVDLRGADIEADLSDPDACGAAVSAIEARAPEGLDGFVPCAGLGPDVADRSLIPRVNYFAVVDMVTGLMPALEKKRGAVVLISSNSSRMTQYNEDYMQAMLDGDRERAVALVQSEVDGQGAYGGSKQALVRWMRRNNPAAAAAGVRVNAIAPGYTETAMTEKGKNDPTYGQAIRDFVASIPLGRPGLPEDQANAARFLLGDQASFISGAVLFVDGGHDAVFRPDEF